MEAVIIVTVLGVGALLWLAVWLLEKATDKPIDFDEIDDPIFSDCLLYQPESPAYTAFQRSVAESCRDT